MLDDINKILLPLNDITQSFGHLKENGENQRVIISAKVDFPSAWKVSKIGNIQPIGIVKATLKEDVYDPHTDYIERDSDGNIIGMYADYYESDLIPITPEEDKPQPKPYDHCVLYSSNSIVKNGGSYRTISGKYLDAQEQDVSENYSDLDKDYFFLVDDVDVSEYVSYVVLDDKNNIKLKFNNSDYIGKILTVRSFVNYIFGEIQLEIV